VAMGIICWRLEYRWNECTLVGTAAQASRNHTSHSTDWEWFWPCFQVSYTCRYAIHKV